MHRRSFIYAFLFISFLVPSLASADGQYGVGQSGQPRTIVWTVSGGAGGCTGATSYPSTAGDGVRAAWATSHSGSGSLTGSSYLAPSGNYSFDCSILDSFGAVIAKDTAWLAVVPAPTGVSATCDNTGKVRIDGTLPTGLPPTTYIPVRIDDLNDSTFSAVSNGACISPGTVTSYSGDYCFDTVAAGFPIIGTLKSGHTYNIWLHALNNGGWSPAVTINNGSFTCPAAGTLSATPNPCTIPSGASNCNPGVAVTFTTNTELATVWVGNSTFMSGTGATSSAVPWIAYGSNVFTLRDGNTQTGTTLATLTVTGNCASGSTWNGSVCAPNACPNGANNPTACDTCTSPQVYNTSSTSCVNPLSVSATNQSITLPTSQFTETYNLTNGSSANTTCRLLDFQGNPVSGSAGTYSSCTGSITSPAPTAAGSYSYSVQAFKSATNETKTSNFTLTVNPASASCTPTTQCEADGNVHNISATCVDTLSQTCTNGCTNGACNSTTGSISVTPTSCTISSGSPTCNVQITWNAASWSNPYIVRVSTLPDGTVSQTTVINPAANTGSNVTVAATYKTDVYKLYSDAFSAMNALATSQTVTTTCASGSSWDTTSKTCKVNTTPVLDITVNPNSYSGTPSATIVARYALTNGTSTDTTCLLLDYQHTPIPGMSASPCSGTLSFTAPTTAGTFGYYIRATQSSTGQTVESNNFLLTITATCGRTTSNNCSLNSSTSGNTIDGTCTAGGTCSGTCNSDGSWTIDNQCDPTNDTPVTITVDSTDVSTTLPDNTVPITYILTGGTAADTNCRITDYQKQHPTAWVPCDGSITITTPTNAGVYGYFIEAFKSVGSQDVFSDEIFVTVDAAPVGASCGSANGAPSFIPPSTNLCGAGNTSSAVQSTFTEWQWTCNGTSDSTDCSAPEEHVGSCGSSDGGAFAQAPSTNLCGFSLTEPTVTTGGGQWLWTCTGDENTDASCSAAILPSLSLTAGALRVQPGATTQLNWVTSLVRLNTCRITDSSDSTYNPRIRSASGNVQTPPINTRSTFTFTCTGQDNSIIRSSITVNLIPKVEEI